MKAKINPQLDALCVSLETLRLDPKNAKIHTPKNLARIKRSLRKYGQQKPIVTIAPKKKGDKPVILAGNGTWRMARHLGWERIARVEYPDEKTARAYALMDNRASEGAKWDQDLVDESLSELDEEGIDPADAGFEDDGVGLDEDLDLQGEKDELEESYQVLVKCTSEEQQAALLSQLKGDGYDVRALIS